MMEPSHDEDGERHKGSPVGARDQIGCRREFADVKFHLSHHAPVGRHLGRHIGKGRHDAFDGNGAVLDRARMRVICNSQRQRN